MGVPQRRRIGEGWGYAETCTAPTRKHMFSWHQCERAKLWYALPFAGEKQYLHAPTQELCVISDASERNTTLQNHVICYDELAYGATANGAPP